MRTFGSKKFREAEKVPGVFSLCDHVTPVNGNSASMSPVITSNSRYVIGLVVGVLMANGSGPGGGGGGMAVRPLAMLVKETMP